MHVDHLRLSRKLQRYSFVRPQLGYRVEDFYLISVVVDIRFYGQGRHCPRQPKLDRIFREIEKYQHLLLLILLDIGEYLFILRRQMGEPPVDLPSMLCLRPVLVRTHTTQVFLTEHQHVLPE